ncbi:MAG: hypothetical protein D6812_05290 [Deltaproteobacteria bacterium]|nr:MAG: hypothetical protein D6812_05290 [Deltaproteobacteria bacterium]
MNQFWRFVLDFRKGRTYNPFLWSHAGVQIVPGGVAAMPAGLAGRRESHAGGIRWEERRRFPPILPYGEMAEWLKAHDC